MRARMRIIAAGLLAAAMLGAPSGLSGTAGGTGSEPGWTLRIPSALAADDDENTKKEQKAEGAATARRAGRPGIGTTLPVAPVTGPSVLKPVEGGATGNGPANDYDCERFATAINMLLDMAQEELTEEGNTDRYEGLLEGAKHTQDDGMDQGCFFVNPL